LVVAAQVLPLRFVGMSGYAYGLIGVWKWWNGSASANRRRLVSRRMAVSA
jgi:hypothetical protein